MLTRGRTSVRYPTTTAEPLTGWLPGLTLGTPYSAGWGNRGLGVHRGVPLHVMIAQRVKGKVVAVVLLHRAV